MMFTSTLTIALLAAAPAAAQAIVQALPGTTDADALAADMRRLGANPRDVDALVDAASLSLRLGDMRAAAALLARAENVEPRNARVKAGQASILVQSERPGEALRYFAQAEALGLDARTFAGDRALAYDLTGEQERAQRDYRNALRDKPTDEETIRRYALSLGISGQRERALALLDPLVRRSDRGAWRAQAFVLAMTGDVGGASRIAATMMPGGAAGLSAFFERLPTLPASDRAFAVHFGEVRASPERIADARLAPALAPLPRQAETVALAANTPVPLNRRDRRQRETQRAQIANVQPTPVLPPSGDARVVSATQPLVTGGLAASAVPVRPLAVTPRVVAPAIAAAVTATPPMTAAAETATMLPPTSTTPVQVAGVTMGTPVPRPGFTALSPQGATTLPANPLTTSSAVRVPPPGFTTPVAATPVTPLATPPVESVGAAPAAVAAVQPRPIVPARTVSRMSEDSILARIVAGLSIPAAELGVGLPERPAVDAPASRPVAADDPAPRPAPVVARVEPSRPDPAIAARTEADRVAGEKRAAVTAAAEKRAADRKAAAAAKALADRKAAAAAKVLADKEAAEARKLARSNPERIWVQVSGGAYEGDLSKAYAAVKEKAPAVFGTRAGYTTPLRATNRVLAGPFKTDAEARAFVNDLRKEGVSAFTFTSDAGQPVSKLGSKGVVAGDDDEPVTGPATKKKASRRR